MATSLQRNQDRPVEDLEDPNLLLLEPQSFRYGLYKFMMGGRYSRATVASRLVESAR